MHFSDSEKAHPMSYQLHDLKSLQSCLHIMKLMTESPDTTRKQANLEILFNT